jgi:hypothetical protein
MPAQVHPNYAAFSVRARTTKAHAFFNLMPAQLLPNLAAFRTKGIEFSIS